MKIDNIGQIKPAGHKIIIRVIEEKSKAGIVLPATAKGNKEQWSGEVIAISPACDLKDAGCEDLKVGDIVVTDCVFSVCAGYEIGDDVYKFINDGDIIAVLEKSKDVEKENINIELGRC